MRGIGRVTRAQLLCQFLTTMRMFLSLVSLLIPGAPHWLRSSASPCLSVAQATTGVEMCPRHCFAQHAIFCANFMLYFNYNAILSTVHVLIGDMKQCKA